MKKAPEQIAREKTAARLVLAGVAVSAVCMVIGLLLFVAAGTSAASAVVTFGLIVLMVTPALQVGFAALEAIRVRDWLFVMLAAAVILVLAMTLALALRTDDEPVAEAHLPFERSAIVAACEAGLKACATGPGLKACATGPGLKACAASGADRESLTAPA